MGDKTNLNPLKVDGHRKSTKDVVIALGSVSRLLSHSEGLSLSYRGSLTVECVSVQRKGNNPMVPYLIHYQWSTS